LSLFEGGMWLALEGRCPWREKSFTRGRAGLVIGRLESKVSYKYSWGDEAVAILKEAVLSPFFLFPFFFWYDLSFFIVKKIPENNQIIFSK